jgi:hypothetical protein
MIHMVRNAVQRKHNRSDRCLALQTWEELQDVQIDVEIGALPPRNDRPLALPSRRTGGIARPHELRLNLRYGKDGRATSKYTVYVLVANVDTSA